MTAAISVVDTNTGQALTVTAVAAELAERELEPPGGTPPPPPPPPPPHRTSFGRLYTNDLAAINAKQAEDVAHALLSGANELRALANDLAGGRWAYQMEIKPELPVVFADLPPDPALQLTPDKLDEEFDREQALKAMVRRKQAEDKWAQQGRVPLVPPELPRMRRWQRVKRAVVAVLQRDADERAL